jgi:hypothetical protein
VLRPAVKQALAYAETMVAKIPGPVDFNQQAFAMNPVVHALFGSAQSMQKAFSLSRPLDDFFQRPENVNVTECCVLLGMSKHEKSVLGSKLRGDVMQKDVQQTVVSFEEHRMVVPSASEEALRKAIVQLFFEDMLATTLEYLENLRASKNELEEQYRRLEVRLRILNARDQGIDAVVKPTGTDAKQAERIRQQMAELEDQFNDASSRLGTLEDQVTLIGRTLSQPQEHMLINPVSFRLDSMGVKVEKNSKERAYDIQLAEVAVGRHLGAVGILARYPRSEMMPREQYLAKAKAYLGL